MYLVEAVSFTDAETKVATEMETRGRKSYDVKALTRKKLDDVIVSEADNWYMVTLAHTNFDEKSQTEKKVLNYALLTANDIKGALVVIEEKIKTYLVDAKIEAVKLMQIEGLI